MQPPVSRGEETQWPHTGSRRTAPIGANEKHSRAVASSVSVDWSLISSHNESRSRLCTCVHLCTCIHTRASGSAATSAARVHVKGIGATRRTGDIKDSETRLINFLI